jgi:hypothetical protein
MGNRDQWFWMVFPLTLPTMLPRSIATISVASIKLGERDLSHVDPVAG